MCTLCAPDGTMASCQDCGVWICFELKGRDDMMTPAYVTTSGDLFCDGCGPAYDLADEEAEHDDVLSWLPPYGDQSL